MYIIYDDIKRETNLLKHGLDFTDLDEGFFREASFEPARRGRLKAIGSFQDRLVIAVIFQPLGTEAFSIISMRPAKRQERARR